MNRPAPAAMTEAAQSSPATLVQTQKTLVLATADPKPWTAPVYYVYRTRKFYFFSGEGSRHITAALSSRRCAGSIFRDGDDWRDIEGLQMDGKLEWIASGVEALGAFDAYVEKFPTVKDFLADARFDFTGFTERFRVRLYAFVPEQSFYLNNRVAFGERREIQLPA